MAPARRKPLPVLEAARPSSSAATPLPAWRILLSDASLETRCGDAVFDRGLDLADDDMVRIERSEDVPRPSVDAVVEGGSRYRVQLWIDQDRLQGGCSCPYYGSSPLCKHAVATAIVWRRRIEAEDDRPATDPGAGRSRGSRTAAIVDERAALRTFLASLPPAALVDRLVSLADRDAEIERELRVWRELERTDLSRASVAPLLARMLAPGRRFIERPRTVAWATRARQAVPLLERLTGRDPAAAVALGVRALRLGWKALAQADDSNGEMGDACVAIGATWVGALRVAGPRPARFGDEYLELLLEQPFDCFEAAEAEAAMGPAALARFRETLADRWRAARSAAIERNRAAAARRRPNDWMPPVPREHDGELFGLEQLHLRQLAAEGDVDGITSVLRARLDHPFDWSRLTAHLVAHGRDREALANARQAYAAFPADARVREDLRRALSRDGAHDELLRLCREWFDAAPTMERFVAVTEACGAAGVDPETVRGALLERMAESEARRGAAVRDVTERVRLFMHEARWEDALALVKEAGTGCRTDVLHGLARVLGPERREQAVVLLERLLSKSMERASSPYRAEQALVREILERLDPAARPAWLNRVRATWGAKRRFIADLPR
ncbi:MAG: hypothetical protein RJA99_1720 [Pseudomonadota bacterium]|jgi:hypothetical protein